jgi:hypothetical protein
MVKGGLPIGTRHRWKNGVVYEKQPDGTWKPVSKNGQLSQDEPRTGKNPKIESSYEAENTESNNQFDTEDQTERGKSSKKNPKSKQQNPDTEQTSKKNIPTIWKEKHFNDFRKYIKEKLGISVLVDESLKDFNINFMQRSIDGVAAVLNDFPAAKKYLKSFGKVIDNENPKKDPRTIYMQCSPEGEIKFGDPYISGANPDIVELLQRELNKGLRKNSRVEWIGMHEAGHLCELALIHKKKELYKSEEEREESWKNCTEAEKIVEEAFERLNDETDNEYKIWKNAAREISDYADDDFSECLAEAIADYTSSKKQCPLFSKIIYDILRNRLGGG